jgi:uncharacterized phage protein gp47/JayE
MGLTITGFTVQTVDEIKTEIETSVKANLTNGANIDVSATSVVGQLIGIFADREHALQLLCRDAWTAFTPSGATGTSLTQLAMLTGTIRADATFSTVTATLSLNAGVTVPAGSQISVDGDPEAVFETLADATNSGGSPATVTVQMQATAAGAVRANAGTLTQIVTPVVGWVAATNVLDAEVGSEDETDPELRLRRETELRVQGAGNLDAIRADVSKVSGVLDVKGFENFTNVTVGVLPPKSFEIVIWDGNPNEADDDAVAQAIWDSKPVGIYSYGGGWSGNAADAVGDLHIVNFTRATEEDVYLEFDLTVDATKYPVDGDTQVKTAVKGYADANWSIDSDVILSALYASVFSISGVVSIDAVRAGFTVSPSGTSNLTITDHQIAIADTSRIVVNS